MDLRQIGALVVATVALGVACSGCSKQRSADGCTYTTDHTPVYVRDSGDLEWVVGGLVRAQCDTEPDAQTLDAALQRRTGRTWATLPPSQYDVQPTVHATSTSDISNKTGEAYEVSADCKPGTYRIRYTARVTRGSDTTSTGLVATKSVTIEHCDDDQ